MPKSQRLKKVNTHKNGDLKILDLKKQIFEKIKVWEVKGLKKQISQSKDSKK